MQICGSTDDERCKRLGSANSEHVTSTASLLARSCISIGACFLFIQLALIEFWHKMSCLSLVEALETLEREFEEADSSYSIDGRVEQAIVDEDWTDEDLEVISPAVEESEGDTVNIEESLTTSRPPVMSSSFVDEDTTIVRHVLPLESLNAGMTESFSSANQEVIPLELSNEDKKEQDTIESFMTKTCGCKRWAI